MKLRFDDVVAQMQILAVVGWLLVLAVGLLGERSPVAKVSQSDFVHFYTVGDIARAGAFSILFDREAQHTWQTRILPASQHLWYRVAYPPLVAVLFAPLSALPFMTAWWLWGAATVAAYVRTLRGLIRTQPGLSERRRIGLVGALAFPPVWLLVINGQTGIFPFLGFALMGMALMRGHRLLAGLAVGLIAIKPQWGILVAILAVLTRDWRLIAGALIALSTEAVATVAVSDVQTLTSYGAALLSLAGEATLSEPKPFLQHSLRVLTERWPLASLFHLGLSMAVTALVWRVWRTSTDERLRMGTLIVGSMLINPHMFVYDAVVLVPAGLWLGAVFDRPWFWWRCYGIAVLLFLPTAYIIPVQLSVVLLFELLIRVVRYALANPTQPELVLPNAATSR